VGTWNEETKKIDFEEDEEEEWMNKRINEKKRKNEIMKIKSFF